MKTLCIKHENRGETYFFCTGKTRIERKEHCEFSQHEPGDCLYWSSFSIAGKHDCLSVAANNECDK